MVIDWGVYGIMHLCFHSDVVYCWDLFVESTIDKMDYIVFDEGRQRDLGRNNSDFQHYRSENNISDLSAAFVLLDKSGWV